MKKGFFPFKIIEIFYLPISLKGRDRKFSNAKFFFAQFFSLIEPESILGSKIAFKRFFPTPPSSSIFG
jgi:hypothetical protein